MGKSQHLAKQQESRVLLSVPSRTILISVDAPERLGIQPDSMHLVFKEKLLLMLTVNVRGGEGGL